MKNINNLFDVKLTAWELLLRASLNRSFLWQISNPQKKRSSTYIKYLITFKSEENPSITAYLFLFLWTRLFFVTSAKVHCLYVVFELNSRLITNTWITLVRGRAPPQRLRSSLAGQAKINLNLHVRVLYRYNLLSEQSMKAGMPYMFAKSRCILWNYLSRKKAKLSTQIIKCWW
jgi:hypothetical protein